MVKLQYRTTGVIVILLMLGASPLSVTYSFADMNEDQDKAVQNETHTEKNSEKERLRAILTEKIVNGKLQVRQYALPYNISDKDLQRMLPLKVIHLDGYM
ncbi:MAG: hypothetical protein ACE5GR_01520 [Nitrosopumilus sp.]